MKRFIIALMMLAGLVAAPLAASDTASAVEVFDACTGGSADTTVCKGKDDKVLGPDGLLTNVINLLLFIIGIVSLIMIIVGGFKYTTSTGDSSQLSNAKDTILYALVGLVIAIMSFAIVNWVVGRI